MDWKVSGDSREGFPRMFSSPAESSFQHQCRDGGFIDIEESDVAESDLMQDDDELYEIGVGLLPERFFAFAKQVV